MTQAEYTCLLRSQGLDGLAHLVLFGASWCYLVTGYKPRPHLCPSNGHHTPWGEGLGWPLPVPSGLGFWAMAAGWPGTAARPTADLQGRVLPPGHLAGAEGHGRIKLGLEQLELLRRLQGLWGDLGRIP